MSGRRALPLLLALAVAVGGCRQRDAELEPDALLRDSLGLEEDDRVHRIRLAGEDNRESAEPATVQVRPGDYVEFVTADRRVHAVAFAMDSLSAAAAAFLRGSGQEGSPPMMEPDSRFVVSFAEAPAGRYPFVVVGNGTLARGSVVVVESPD